MVIITMEQGVDPEKTARVILTIDEFNCRHVPIYGTALTIIIGVEEFEEQINGPAIRALPGVAKVSRISRSLSRLEKDLTIVANTALQGAQASQAVS